MLSTTLSTDERITTAHRAKLAYVYVRQSSPGQVRHHQESTELQYRLVERATVFGWPRERVHVIDDDLGKSGTSSKDRYGFQTLIAEVGLGKAGLVMSLDASRLARNNRDWHQLLELCSLFGVLIADGERLYDPAAYHDRLLLGLSGIMSEAELHQIKIRLHQGERQKAARGELRLPLPAGLIHTRDGGVTFNPDEEVQERLRLVFAKFRELRSAKAVMRYLRRGNLLLPVRPLHGPAPHDVVWQPADSARVINILKNPAYAGAYVYGRRRPDPLRRQPGSDRIGTTAVAPEDWSICLKDAHRRLWRMSRRPAMRGVRAHISTGTSSWRTEGSLRTTSVATMRAGPAPRVKATHCCRGLSAVVGAPVGWACDTRDRTGTIRSMSASPIAARRVGRDAKKYGLSRLTPKSSG